MRDSGLHGLLIFLSLDFSATKSENRKLKLVWLPPTTVVTKKKNINIICVIEKSTQKLREKSTVFIIYLNGMGSV